LCFLLIDHLIASHSTRDSTGRTASESPPVETSIYCEVPKQEFNLVQNSFAPYNTIFNTTNPLAITLRVTGLGSGIEERKQIRRRSKIKEQ
jgi:hypothetical protein